MSKPTMPCLLALLLAAGAGGSRLLAQSVFYAKEGKWKLAYRKADPDKLGAKGSLSFYELTNGQPAKKAAFTYDKNTPDSKFFQPAAGKRYLMRVKDVAQGTQLEFWLDDLNQATNPFHAILDAVVGDDAASFGKFTWIGWKWNRVSTKPGLPSTGYQNVFDAKDWAAGNLTVVVPAFAGMP
jgi:hypothetical protein